MKWYEKTWATILFLILFFPAGLYLMWRYRNWNKILKGVITGFFALCVIANMANGGSNSNTTNTVTKESVKQEESTSTNTDANSSVQKEENKETKEVEDKKDSNIPTEYIAALKKAQMYSDNMHMSKAGIYDQLTSEYGEKFPAEAAQYAIDNVKADWNKNALEKAKSYQKDMAMSKSAIQDQLISEYGEKFTADEAQYAVNNLE